MRILVTGAAGFIGSHLVEHLVAAGHSVTGLDDLSAGSEGNLSAVASHPAFRFVEGDCADGKTVAALAGGGDAIVHLAATVGVARVAECPVDAIRNNLQATEAVLETSSQCGLRVLIASSSEVYGKSSSFPLAEDEVLLLGPTQSARFSYACSKAMDEWTALAHRRQHDTAVTIVRLFNTVGPRQSSQHGMVLPRFVDAALAGRPLIVHGDGRQSRCFAHVEEVVDALHRLLQSEQSVGEVYNVGCDEEVRIVDLARRVIQATGSDSAIAFQPFESVYGAGFEDFGRRVPDLRKVETAVGWRATRDLDAIVADVVAAREGARVS